MKNTQSPSMQLFYTTDIQGDFAYLNEVEARHAIQVLRHQIGDELFIVDGHGNLITAEITEASKKKCTLRIRSRQESYRKRSFHLSIAISPPKNISRLEWFLEKTTELGIDEIIPIKCQHSERNKLRPERLEKVLVSAMKQSYKAKMPRLYELTPFRKLMERTDLPKRRYIAHCEEGNKVFIGKNYEVGEDAIILIGPEGDFSEEEIRLAKEKGFEEVSLGENRLRTETSGVMVCTVLNYLNEREDI